ncbi:leucine-rich repeat domain-containing protein [Blautia sp. MSK.20.9]|uniref:leucine-rich repeat domain-containing protein n=1 Tax=Blautia sp. MSK20_18 TaxID=2883186 RepID=UPI00156EB817|nr:leucine-rich repeat domain-containing protein [Blautia sp. MSK20_18]MCB7508680.1 leucine-rich repeat domain-containing protein [Blautia sp. MSK20_18]NSK12304.1 leucine-rich repeat domain-containing protein [Blautia sp. MSK.20.9]
MRKETKNGVMYTFEEDGFANEAVDVEVQPGIECLILQYGLNMPESEKSFPDVKCLTIKKDVQRIEIPNTLFPNVKRVVSEDLRNFESGRYLVRNMVRRTLKNVFCPAEDEVVEIPNVYYIGAYAFKDCKSTKISTRRYISCDKNAFAGSAFMEQPFTLGVKMAGRILIDVDPTVEEVILPDEEEQILAFAKEVDLRDVKHLVLHNVDSLERLLYDKGLPQKVTFIPSDNNLENLKYEIRHLARVSRNAEYIKEIEVISPYVKCVNGIIYTSDMKTIIASTMYQTDIVIPEGVENIDREAFAGCHLTSIKLPDSLKNIKKEAFRRCMNLRSVVFGTGVTKIPSYTFENCINLENVILPPNLEKICDGAFKSTNLSNIKLTEGLKEIRYHAFDDTPMQEIVIPSTASLSGSAFGKNMEHITTLQYSESLIACCSTAYEPRYSEIAGYVIRLDCGGKTAYLPKYLKPGLYKEFLKTVSYFLQDFRQEHCEFWEFGYSAKGKEYAALAEYLAFGGETAKVYLKKNSKRIITRLLKEGDEENAAAFLKAGFVSKITLKTLLTIAEKNDMMTIKSYILSQINESGITKKNFSL